MNPSTGTSSVGATTPAAARSAKASVMTGMTLMRFGCNIILPPSLSTPSGPPSNASDWFLTQVAGSGFTGDSSGGIPRLTALASTVTNLYCNPSVMEEELTQSQQEGTLPPLEASSAAAMVINNWGSHVTSARTATNGALWLPAVPPPQRLLTGCGIGPVIFVMMKEQWEVMAKHFNQPGYVPRISFLITPTTQAIHSGARVPETSSPRDFEKQLERLHAQTYDEVRMSWNADCAAAASSNPTPHQKPGEMDTGKPLKCPAPQLEFLRGGAGPFVLRLTSFSIQKRKPLDPSKLTKDGGIPMPTATKKDSSSTTTNKVDLNLPEEDAIVINTRLCVSANGYLYTLELEAFEEVYQRHSGEFFDKVAKGVKLWGVPQFGVAMFNNGRRGGSSSSSPVVAAHTSIMDTSLHILSRLKADPNNPLATVGIAATYGPLMPPMLGNTFAHLDYTRGPHFQLRIPSTFTSSTTSDGNTTVLWNLLFPSEWRYLQPTPTPTSNTSRSVFYDPYTKRLETRRDTTTALDRLRFAIGGVASFVSHRSGYHSTASPAPRPHLISVIHPHLADAPFRSADSFIEELLKHDDSQERNTRWVERLRDATKGLPAAVGGGGGEEDIHVWDGVIPGASNLIRRSFFQVLTVNGAPEPSSFATSQSVPISDLIVYSLATSSGSVFVVVRGIDPIDYELVLKKQLGGAPWCAMPPTNTHHTSNGIPVSFIASPSFAQPNQQQLSHLATLLNNNANGNYYLQDGSQTSSSYLCRAVSPVDCLQLLNTTLLIAPSNTSTSTQTSTSLNFIHSQGGYKLASGSVHHHPTVISHPMANNLGTLLQPFSTHQQPSGDGDFAPKFIGMSCNVRRMAYLPKDAWEALLKKEAEVLYGDETVNKLKFHVRATQHRDAKTCFGGGSSVPAAFLKKQSEWSAVSGAIGEAEYNHLVTSHVQSILQAMGVNSRPTLEILTFDHVFDEPHFFGTRRSSTPSTTKLLKRICVFSLIVNPDDAPAVNSIGRPLPSIALRFGSVVATWDFHLTKEADLLGGVLGPVPPAFIGSPMIPSQVPGSNDGGNEEPKLVQLPYPHPAHSPNARPQGPLGSPAEWDADWQRVHNVLDRFQAHFEFIL